jgi:23S rRNA pseudouridine1911/1915/1917 synthase
VRKRFEFQAEKADSKKRLEDFLFERFENLSKMYLRDAVKSELCEVNGRFENRGYRLRANDFVEVEVDPARETAMRPQDIALDIVYEDESLAVINKPSGMLVHPTHAEKNGTMLNALAHHMNRGKGDKAFIRPGLIHRLDRHTSGLIVVAKTARAHRVLAGHFQRKLVDKRYLAVVDGVVEQDTGTIEAPIGRFADRKYWDVNEDGKHAETRFKVMERFVSATLLELEPVTGRTNQLRIHCAHIGHPIVGDVDRGGSDFPRMCLHAWKLAFQHPEGSRRLEFEARVPEEMRTFSTGMEWIKR